MNGKLVRDLMHIGVTTCFVETPLVEAVRKLLQERLESLVVLDSNGHAVGLLTRKEVVEAIGRLNLIGDEPMEITVGQVMRSEIPEVPPDIPATVAAQIMIDQGVRALYLLHHDSGISWPAAELRFEDLMRYLAAESEADIADMGAGAARKTPFELFKERYSK